VGREEGGGGAGREEEEGGGDRAGSSLQGFCKADMRFVSLLEGLDNAGASLFNGVVMVLKGC